MAAVQLPVAAGFFASVFELLNMCRPLFEEFLDRGADVNPHPLAALPFAL